MWSAQAVRDSKIDHTQRHLSTLRNSAVGWHWNTHICAEKFIVIVQMQSCFIEANSHMKQFRIIDHSVARFFFTTLFFHKSNTATFAISFQGTESL